MINQCIMRQYFKLLCCGLIPIFLTNLDFYCDHTVPSLSFTAKNTVSTERYGMGHSTVTVSVRYGHGNSLNSLEILYKRNISYGLILKYRSSFNPHHLVSLANYFCNIWLMRSNSQIKL